MRCIGRVSKSICLEIGGLAPQEEDNFENALYYRADLGSFDYHGAMHRGSCAFHYHLSVFGHCSL